MDVPSDWYKTFFSGLVVEGWLGAMPPEYTQKEAEFIRAKLCVAPPAKLLDVPCGGGRHALALAKAGFAMTGVDISSEFLNAARSNTGNLPIEWRQSDMTDLPWTSAFDGAFCFGNSFGYLADADNPRFLHAVARALKPGARFILDHPTCLESIATLFMPTSSHQMGDLKCDRNGRYDPAQGRIIVEYTFSHGDRVERKTVSHRCYTYRQVCEMLANAGFKDIHGFTNLEGEPFGLGSKGLLVVATK